MQFILDQITQDILVQGPIKISGKAAIVERTLDMPPINCLKAVWSCCRWQGLIIRKLLNFSPWCCKRLCSNLYHLAKKSLQNPWAEVMGHAEANLSWSNARLGHFDNNNKIISKVLRTQAIWILKCRIISIISTQVLFHWEALQTFPSFFHSKHSFEQITWWHFFLNLIQRYCITIQSQTENIIAAVATI